MVQSSLLPLAQVLAPGTNWGYVGAAILAACAALLLLVRLFSRDAHPQVKSKLSFEVFLVGALAAIVALCSHPVVGPAIFRALMGIGS